jgi:hypothetical protein
MYEILSYFQMFLSSVHFNISQIYYKIVNALFLLISYFMKTAEIIKS